MVVLLESIGYASLKLAFNILLVLFYSSNSNSVADHLGNFTVIFKDLNVFNNSKSVIEPCCSPQNVSSIECNQRCNIYLRICLHVFMQPLPTQQNQCAFWEYITPVVEKSALLEFSKKLTKWKGSFTLIIEAYSDLNGTLKERPLLRSVIDEENYRSPFSWSTRSMKSADMELTYSYRFQCAQHLYGKKCEVYCKSRNDSHGHWSCSNEGRRICMKGYDGDGCIQPLCPQGCLHGQCMAPDVCRCTIGWEGKSCNNCVKFPGCIQGTCKKAFECNCNTGYGGMFCNVDLNWCTRNKNPCSNGGTCLNRKGDASFNYTCACPNGFAGTHCERLVSNCTHHDCFNGGVCQNNATWECTCPKGFYGRYCQFNETTCDDAPCKNEGQCVPMLFGNEANPHRFRCECRNGWSGQNCDVDIDDCASNPCQNGGRCVDQISGYTCICRFGFQGPQCQVNTDDCHTLSCLNGAICQDHVNRVECSCALGFTGSRCHINIDDCSGKPCRNSGHCKDAINDFKCDCSPDFSGKQCEYNMSEPCATQPCENGGLCTPTKSVGFNTPFTCTCFNGFTGSLCQRKLITPTITATVLAGHHELHKQLNMSKVELLLIALLGLVVPILAILISIFLFMWRRHRQTLQMQRALQLQSAVLTQGEKNSLCNIQNKLFDVDYCDNDVTSSRTTFLGPDIGPNFHGRASSVNSLIFNNNYNMSKLKNHSLLALTEHGQQASKCNDAGSAFLSAKVNNQMANLLTANYDSKMTEQEAHFRSKYLSTSALRIDSALAQPPRLHRTAADEASLPMSTFFSPWPSHTYQWNSQMAPSHRAPVGSRRPPPPPPLRSSSRSCDNVAAAAASAAVAAEKRPTMCRNDLNNPPPRLQSAKSVFTLSRSTSFFTDV